MSVWVRRTVPVVVTVLAFGLVGVSLAWACSPNANITFTGAAAGPPGTETEVLGSGFEAEREVEIHGGSKDGPVVADARPAETGTYMDPKTEATGREKEGDSDVIVYRKGTSDEYEGPKDEALELGGDFEVEVTVPKDAEGDTYAFYAVQPGGFKEEVAPVRFKIERPTEPGDGTGNEGGGQPGDGAGDESPVDAGGERSGDGTSGVGGQPGDGSTASSPVDAWSPGPGVGIVPTPSRAGTRPPVVRDPRAPGRASGPSRGRGGVRVEGGSNASPVVRGRSGERLFGGSTSPADGAGGRSASSAEAAGVLGAGAASTSPPPSEQSASGDLWSGFSSGPAGSLVPGPTHGAPGDGQSVQLGVGMALLGFGLVALLAGFGFAEIRRRRSLAG